LQKIFDKAIDKRLKDEGLKKSTRRKKYQGNEKNDLFFRLDKLTNISSGGMAANNAWYEDLLKIVKNKAAVEDR
jgi:hypothetical protein